METLVDNLSDTDLLVELLVRQLPDRRIWTTDQRQRWLQAMTALVDLMIETCDPLPLEEGEGIDQDRGHVPEVGRNSDRPNPLPTYGQQPYLSAEDAESVYGFSRGTIRSWVQRGQLVPVEARQGVRGRPMHVFTQEDLERLVGESRGPRSTRGDEKPLTADEAHAESPDAPTAHPDQPRRAKTKAEWIEAIHQRRQDHPEGHQVLFAQLADEIRGETSVVPPLVPVELPSTPGDLKARRIAQDADALLPAHLMAEMGEVLRVDDSPSQAPSGHVQPEPSHGLQTKQQTWRQRQIAMGKCPHCGQDCAPYFECEERRVQKRAMPRQASNRFAAIHDTIARNRQDGHVQKALDELSHAAEP